MGDDNNDDTADVPDHFPDTEVNQQFESAIRYLDDQIPDYDNEPAYINGLRQSRHLIRQFHLTFAAGLSCDCDGQGVALAEGKTHGVWWCSDCGVELLDESDRG